MRGVRTAQKIIPVAGANSGRSRQINAVSIAALRRDVAVAGKAETDDVLCRRDAGAEDQARKARADAMEFCSTLIHGMNELLVIGLVLWRKNYIRSAASQGSRHLRMEVPNSKCCGCC